MSKYKSARNANSDTWIYLEKTVRLMLTEMIIIVVNVVHKIRELLIAFISP